MPTGRRSLGAARGADGRIYAIGGDSSGSVVALTTPGLTGPATAAIAVADQAPVVTVSAALSATVGMAFSGPVAGFTDAGGADPNGNYKATIDWGDGTAVDSAGT